MKTNYLAFDLGAESGRTILGVLDNRRLTIRELTRFPGGKLRIHGHDHWNVFRLFEEMKKGMQVCATEVTSNMESISVDAWGLDFALLDCEGEFLGLPYTHRDPLRTNGTMEELIRRISKERLYQLTGTQMMPVNSIYQLVAMKRDKFSVLNIVRDLLFIPDIFNYFFTGKKISEFSYATTSQLYNPLKEDWEDELFEILGISKGIMQAIVQPGTIISVLGREISEETGLEQLPVIACASHDTGSAVAAAPAEGNDWAYISSGTWSLMGIENQEPIMSKEAMKFNFTNEGGVEGTFRFLKNIMGLWLLQQCRESWAKDHMYTYNELTQIAASAASFRSIIDPDDISFLNPPDMADAICRFCEKTTQRIPETHAQITRCVLESLALKYRFVLDQIRQVSSYPINRIHIIGGGAKNELLCRFTANASGIPVIAGPTEATAIGNIMVQALAMGHVASLSEIREIIRDSFNPVTYYPDSVREWENAYERFQSIVCI